MNGINFRSARRRAGVGLALALGASLALVSPAEATIVATEHYAGTFQDDFPLCGIDVHLDVEFSGRLKIREGKGPDAGAFFAQDHFSVLETFTNPENGNYFTITRNGVFQELRATRIEGTVFEFISHEVGQPFVLRDMDGNVIVRDRGAIIYRQVFDTLGDDEPGGDELDFEVVRIAGPHPGFVADEADVCGVVTSLLG